MFSSNSCLVISNVTATSGLSGSTMTVDVEPSESSILHSSAIALRVMSDLRSALTSSGVTPASAQYLSSIAL